MQNPNDEFFDELILNGFIEPAAFDSESGEMLYSFTEKARIEMPDMQRQADEYFHSMIMFFWENGFISMDMDSSNPTVSLTQKSFDEAEINNLSADQKVSLNIIKEALRIQ